MTEIARREYWERNLEFANRAQEYADKQLDKIQIDGQLSFDIGAAAIKATNLPAKKTPELRIA